LPVAAFEVSIKLLPWQIVVGPPPWIPTTGVAGLVVTFTTTAFDGADVHVAVFTTTVYEPASVAVKVWFWADASRISSPLYCHWLPVVEDEVSTTEPPSQKVVEPENVTDGVAGVEFTVTVMVFDASELQPATVPVTLTR
jgi:hypothetical protein